MSVTNYRLPPTFSPGLRHFNKGITRHYNRTSDNPDTIDFNYLLKFCQAYTYAARLIANRASRPRWSAGDQYEPVAKALYGY